MKRMTIRPGEYVVASGNARDAHDACEMIIFQGSIWPHGFY